MSVLCAAPSAIARWKRQLMTFAISHTIGQFHETHRSLLSLSLSLGTETGLGCEQQRSFSVSFFSSSHFITKAKMKREKNASKKPLAIRPRRRVKKVIKERGGKINSIPFRDDDVAEWCERSWSFDAHDAMTHVNKFSSLLVQLQIKKKSPTDPNISSTSRARVCSPSRSKFSECYLNSEIIVMLMVWNSKARDRACCCGIQGDSR